MTDDQQQFPGSTGQPPQPQPRAYESRSSSATVEDAIETTKRFLGENQSLALGIFGLYAALLLIGSMLGVVVSMVTGVAELQMQQTAMSPEQASDPAYALELMRKMAPSLAISLVYGVVANGFYAATFSPARDALFSDTTPSFAAAAGQLGRAFGKGVGAVLVLGVIVGLGLAFCILPGVIAYFFLIPYYYLVCGRDEPIFESVSTSFSWAKDNAGIVATIFGVQIVMFFVLGCLQGATTQPILEAMGKPGLFLTSIISWLTMTMATFPVWLLAVGSMAAIEKAETA